MTELAEGSERDGGYSVRAAERVCDILDVLARGTSPLPLGELALRCRLPKSSMFRYLSTLEARRYVERDVHTDGYRLGTAVLSFQATHVDRLAGRLRPILERLRDRLGETTNLGVLDGSRVAYLDIVESPRSMRLAARPGDRDMLHCTALGKAIAARMDPERLQAALDAEGLPRRTDRTLTSRAQLAETLRTVRERGYAVDDGENEVGGRCVAVALPGPVLAAISVSAPAMRITDADVPAVAETLQAAVNELHNNTPVG